LYCTMLQVPSDVEALAIKNSYEPSFDIYEPTIVPGSGLERFLFLSCSYILVPVF
jgi:hypothetical protein